MRLSDAERLILVMLSDIYQKLGIEDEIDPEFVKEAIYSGRTWGLRWKYPGIFGAGEHEPDPPEVKEAADILDMWELVERAYARLTVEEKESIATEVEPWDRNVQFLGFDANNEGAYFSIAMFFIDDMGKFSGFKGRDLNSHWPVLSGYRRMLAVFGPMRKTLDRTLLSAAQLVELLQAYKADRAF